MKSFSATDARANLYKLLDQIALEHQPLHIKGKRSSAILISEADWSAMQETLYLLSVPGMRESLLESKKEKLSTCVEKLKW
jgi:antitoxin YefM